MDLKEHIRRNIKLALPVMITQAGQISVNLIDNIMVGGLGGKWDIVKDENLGKVALASVSLGNAIFFTFMVFAFGFSFALSPLIASADARNNKEEAVDFFKHSLILNVILAFILYGLAVAFRPFAHLLGQPPEVIDSMLPFLTIMTFSMVPLLIFQTFRQLSEGLSLTIPVAVATLLANVVNIILNLGFIYGYFGFPRMEVEGAALGTMLARVFMLIFLIGVLLYWKKSKEYISKLNFKGIRWSRFRILLNLGIPTALTSFFEMSAFSFAAFICGYTFNQTAQDLELAKINLAAHQIAISLASTTFMMCIGLGVAATVRIGNQIGLRDYKTMRAAGWSAILMVVIFMSITAILMISLRFYLPTFYIDNKNVINLAAQLLIVASVFQLSDGAQLVCLGALRGMQDVKVPSVITFVSYWLIAVPIGAWLAIGLEMRALGMWIGLGFGLTISAVLMIRRYNLLTIKMINNN